MTATPAGLLALWLERQLPPPAFAWLAAAAAGDGADLFLQIGQAARRVGKAELALGHQDLAAADAARPGWRPAGLSTDQAARLLLLLSAPGDGKMLARRLDALCAAADVGELTAWYRGLPLYPDPARHAARAAEGLRSTMRSVFEAVAHHNPYPAEALDIGAFNQMVLKAVFVGSALAPIVGLEQRANPDLGRMLRDYAAERRAAGRSVPEDLWGCLDWCHEERP